MSNLNKENEFIWSASTVSTVKIFFFSVIYHYFALFSILSTLFFARFVCLSVVKSDDVHVLIPFFSQVSLRKSVDRFVRMIATTAFLYLLLRIS